MRIPGQPPATHQGDVSPTPELVRYSDSTLAYSFRKPDDVLKLGALSIGDDTIDFNSLDASNGELAIVNMRSGNLIGLGLGYFYDRHSRLSGRIGTTLAARGLPELTIRQPWGIPGAAGIPGVNARDHVVEVNIFSNAISEETMSPDESATYPYLNWRNEGAVNPFPVVRHLLQQTQAAFEAHNPQSN